MADATGAKPMTPAATTREAKIFTTLLLLVPTTKLGATLYEPTMKAVVTFWLNRNPRRGRSAFSRRGDKSPDSFGEAGTMGRSRTLSTVVTISEEA
jgi:hypothetical protein